MKKYLKLFYVLFIISTVFGTLYVLVLQQNRLQANDIPTNVANEAANVLGSITNIPENQIARLNVLETTNPFFMVYDLKGNPIAGSGYIDGKLAELPAGVIKHATPGKNHAVTWAPTENMRFATVTVASNKFYVTAGQSLANVERRADTLRKWWFLGYAISIGVTLTIFMATKIKSFRLTRPKQLIVQNNGAEIVESDPKIEQSVDSDVPDATPEEAISTKGQSDNGSNTSVDYEGQARSDENGSEINDAEKQA